MTSPASGEKGTGGPSIADVLDDAARRSPEKIAYGTEGERGLTYSALLQAATGVAERLRHLGSIRAAVAEPNGPIVPATLFGSSQAGATYIPLNYRLPQKSLGELLRRLDPLTMVRGDWLAMSTSDSPPSEPGEPAAIVFTSGSSAEPKAVVLKNAHLIAAALREPAGSADDGDALLLAAPPFHLPNILVTLAAVRTGRRIVPFDVSRFSASAWLDIVEGEQITHTVIVPTMLHRIVQEMEQTGRRVPSLKRLTYGSARLPLPVLERALELFPTTDFSNGYGSTESTGAVSILTAADHREAAGSEDPTVRARLKSAGRALPRVAIRIVGVEGTEVPDGETGEIQVRGPQISGAYLDSPSVVDDEGWLATGDEGWLDGDGYLFCIGRGLSTIICGGENIAAAEIEDVLVRHPAVREAAVVGLPDDEWGEVVAAMVTTRAEAQLDAGSVRAWVREQLGSLKTPRIVVFTDELPRTETGKILHRQVRHQIESRALAQEPS